MKNYRPISNTPFLAKLIETCALTQINLHLQGITLNGKTQSAYRVNHSCETAIAKIVNDIQKEVVNKNIVLLLMLDLSAAFDTVDQDRLLEKLEKTFFIRGNVLKLLRSYMTGRTYSVCVEGISSKSRPLRYGVPQGSI